MSASWACKWAPAGALLLATLVLAACDQPEMENQPKFEPYEAAGGWPDNQSARHPPAGTVARGAELGPSPTTIPMAIDRDLLERGRHGYEVFCSPCHGLTGAGDGMVVRRGFPAPPSFHSERLRAAPARHFFAVITHGFGIMYSYAARVPPGERWAIAAYIQALQLSQHFPAAALRPEQRAKLGPDHGGSQ